MINTLPFDLVNFGIYTLIHLASMCVNYNYYTHEEEI